MLTVQVPDCNKTCGYVVPAPVAIAYTPPGCATCGSRAWDILERMIVYLKDMWRVDLKGFVPESETYELLMKNNVPNIAKCLASGDISDSKYHSTKSQLYKDELWACPTTTQLIPH